MTKIRRSIKIVTITMTLTCFFIHTAAAYVGPGAGLSAIGAFLGVIVGLIAAIFGFVWYPIKRLMQKRRKPEDNKEDENQRF